MKNRVAPVVAVLALSVTASAAHASAVEPATGPWKDKDGEVSFTVKKTDSGYTAASTRVFIGAGCEAANPKDSATARGLLVNNLSVKLTRSGGKLRGSKTVTRPRDRGKATETVRFTITVVGTRRATVTGSGKYETKVDDPNSNSNDCSGRVKTTVRPK